MHNYARNHHHPPQKKKNTTPPINPIFVVPSPKGWYPLHVGGFQRSLQRHQRNHHLRVGLREPTKTKDGPNFSGKCQLIIDVFCMVSLVLIDWYILCFENYVDTSVFLLLAFLSCMMFSLLKPQSPILAADFSP